MTVIELLVAKALVAVGEAERLLEQAYQIENRQYEDPPQDEIILAYRKAAEACRYVRGLLREEDR